MYFILLYDYVADAETRRAPLRPDHLAHARDYNERGLLVTAGAFAKPLDGAALVFKADDRSAVEAFVASDPYVTGGLVTDWRIREWTVVIGGDSGR